MIRTFATRQSSSPSVADAARPADRSARSLIGVGVYTLAEAGRLTGIPAAKLTRWLCGHEASGRRYEPLWQPEVDLGDGKLYLGFRDLLEAKVAGGFIAAGLSPQRVRSVIELCRKVAGDHPLSTAWFRTDGRSVFLSVGQAEADEPRLLNVAANQYVFNTIVERTLRDVEFDGHFPRVWWPLTRRGGVLVDPGRSFGQPIEHLTSIPTITLANAAVAEGSAEAAAKAWNVPVAAIQRSVRFQQRMATKMAA